MYQVIIVVHVLLGLGIIGFVLIQQGKGADAGAAFGSGSSGSVFGSQGAGTFLSKTTAILAALFFSTSLGLAILSGHQEDSVDLMDTPETELVEDLPLINGVSNAPESESLPVIDELPGTVENPLQKVVTESTDKIVDAVEQAKPVISDVVEQLEQTNDVNQ